MLASYTGILPDTFKDEAEVVLKGRLTTDGHFAVEPNGVMAKCPSKYEEKCRTTTLRQAPVTRDLKIYSISRSKDSESPYGNTRLHRPPRHLRRLQLRGGRVGRRRAARLAAAHRKRHRRVPYGDGADGDGVGADGPRLRHRRFLHQVRVALFRLVPAAVLQDHVVLGRARRLDHVLGVPAGVLRQPGGAREPRSPSRADSLCRRGDLPGCRCSFCSS